MTGPLSAARRIVVKVGSSLLVDPATGALRRPWLDAFAADIAALMAQKKTVILASSGAIALGRRSLRLPPGKLRLEDSQAAAAVGQVRLAQAYVDAFQAHGVGVAQILLTVGDTEDRRRYLNARETLSTLLGFGVLPVINENDTVATAEIRFGDNDRLAARVATMMEADTLVLLSDVDGLYTADPALPGAEHIAEVTAITADIEAMAQGPASAVGSGGMRSKLAAAKIATAAGVNTIVADGRAEHPVAAIANGARTTTFLARTTPAAARKRWIAGSLRATGTLVIDAGAERALIGGKSLLPAGVMRVEGTFQRGDAILVRNEAGIEIARGLIAYGNEDACRVAGKRSAEIEAILGYRGRDEIIHRDDMALSARATPERAHT